MLYRYMYAAFPKNPEKEELVFTNDPAADAVSASFFGKTVFLYYETETEQLPPERVVNADLIAFPDGKLWSKMADVFHYSVPTSKEQWARKVSEKQPWVRINRLNPDKISEYLYYHFQYQEERPGGGPDRYGSIFLFENYIVHYLEWPFEREEHPAKGSLSTNLTPADNDDVWQALMKTFFLPWEDTPYPWHSMVTKTPDGRRICLPEDHGS